MSHQRGINDYFMLFSWCFMVFHGLFMGISSTGEAGGNKHRRITNESSAARHRPYMSLVWG
ncbi:MAG: hypothetical protein ACPGWR_02670 [Ardenticatenaceae bacterium]